MAIGGSRLNGHHQAIIIDYGMLLITKDRLAALLDPACFGIHARLRHFDHAHGRLGICFIVPVFAVVDHFVGRLDLRFALTVCDARIHMTSLGYHDAVRLYLLVDYRQQPIPCASCGQPGPETGQCRMIRHVVFQIQTQKAHDVQI